MSYDAGIAKSKENIQWTRVSESKQRMLILLHQKVYIFVLDYYHEDILIQLHIFIGIIAKYHNLPAIVSMYMSSRNLHLSFRANSIINTTKCSEPDIGKSN